MSPSHVLGLLSTIAKQVLRRDYDHRLKLHDGNAISLAKDIVPVGPRDGGRVLVALREFTHSLVLMFAGRAVLPPRGEGKSACSSITPDCDLTHIQSQP